MENIKIRIDTANSAFDEAPATEVARILRDLAECFEQGDEVEGALRDINGNFCGEVIVTVGEPA